VILLQFHWRGGRILLMPSAVLCQFGVSLFSMLFVLTSGADDMVEQMHAVVQEQQQEIEHLQNVLEGLTSQHRASTSG